MNENSPEPPILPFFWGRPEFNANAAPGVLKAAVQFLMGTQLGHQGCATDLCWNLIVWGLSSRQVIGFLQTVSLWCGFP